MQVTLPIIMPSSVGGDVERGNNIGGFEYGGGTVDPQPRVANWPRGFYENTDTDGIDIGGDFARDFPDQVNNTEGPEAVFQNGGAMQVQPDWTMSQIKLPESVSDTIDLPWTGTGVAPYQVDTNLLGPVTGDGEGFTGNTLQPDYYAQGQFGVATGGGTGRNDTVTGYYLSQSDQVVRDYTAAALFAST